MNERIICNWAADAYQDDRRVKDNERQDCPTYSNAHFGQFPSYSPGSIVLFKMIRSGSLPINLSVVFVAIASFAEVVEDLQQISKKIAQHVD